MRAWPDREALLADRALAIGELQRRGLTLGRLLLLWAYGLVAWLGWALFSLGIGSFLDGSADYVTGSVELVFGLCFLLPAMIGIGFAVARDGAIRGRLNAWAALGPDRENDRRLRAGGRCAVWLGLSAGLCVVGLLLVLTGVAQPDSSGVGMAAYLVGIGVIALVIGALGAMRALGHQRWAGRLLGPVPVREGGGTHR